MINRIDIGECLICGKRNRYRRICNLDEGRLQVISCECGHQFVFPVPTEKRLAEIYGLEYYDFMGFNNNFEHVFNLKLKSCERIIRQADSLISCVSDERRHLDIGCAFGYMIKAAQRAGYVSQGLEISAAADEAIRLGFNIKKVPLEKAGFPDSYFDLITAVDLIEHLLDPKEFLEECNRILKKGGVLLLVTPDCSSIPARIMKGRWPHYKVEHLHYYTPHTLKKLLSSIGFGEIWSGIGMKWLTLRYITNHYEKYHPHSIEARILRVLGILSPRKLFEYPLPFPTEMVVMGKRM